MLHKREKPRNLKKSRICKDLREVRAYGLQLLRDDAEACDLMQDVFLRIYSASERLDMESPSSLLWNTATRLCLNRIRDKRRRGLDVDSSSLLLSIACAEDEHDDYETKNVLAKLFSKEPESSRTMAVLHFVDGMTLEETAREVGLSVSGVRKRLRAFARVTGQS